MPKISSALTLILTVLACGGAVAQSSSVNKVLEDGARAARLTLATHRASGMSGLRVQSNDCYRRLQADQFPCVYLDIASRYLDQGAVALYKFPPDEYFDDNQYFSRIGGVLAKANLNMEQANGFLAFITPAIVQELTLQINRK